MYAKALARGERRAAYAAQVLRAVLNWHGIKVPDSPFSRDVPGKLRIPPNLDTDSTPKWTPSERSDAGFWVFTLKPPGSSILPVSCAGNLLSA